MLHVLNSIEWLLIATIFFIMFTCVLACLGNGRNVLAAAALLAGLMELIVLVLIVGCGWPISPWVPIVLGGIFLFWLGCTALAVPIVEYPASGPQLPNMDGDMPVEVYQGGFWEHMLRKE